MHTWGDFVFGGKRGFDREDAIEHAEVLAKAGCAPRVWIDHSIFIGNLLHVHQYGGIPEIRDASGFVYTNPFYTLDLIRKAGVRYVWDGTVTPVLGQGRPMGLLRYHVQYTGSVGAGVTNYFKHLLAHAFGVGVDLRKKFHGNTLYRSHRFPDGNTFYTFQRHGSLASAPTGAGSPYRRSVVTRSRIGHFLPGGLNRMTKRQTDDHRTPPAR